MRERLTMLAPVLLLCLLGAGAHPLSARAQAPAQAPAPNAPREKRAARASTCVRYQQELGPDRQSVNLRLVNECDDIVTCDLSWKLQCDGQKPRTRELHSFDLATGEQRTTNASAEVCGEAGWNVRDVRWRCASAR